MILMWPQLWTYKYVLTAKKYDFTYENIGGHGEGKSYAIVLC